MSMAVSSDDSAVSVDRYGYMDKSALPSRAVYYFTLAVLVVGLFLMMTGICQAEDLLKPGDSAVNYTVGKKSAVLRWMLMLEVLAAIFGFILTRNMRILGGIVALAIFINICYSIIGTGAAS